MSGPWLLVVRQDGGVNANFSKSVTAPSPRTSPGPPQFARFGARHLLSRQSRANYIKMLDPGYTGNDVQITAKVNYLDDECSAYWTGAPRH